MVRTMFHDTYHDSWYVRVYKGLGVVVCLILLIVNLGVNSVCPLTFLIVNVGRDRHCPLSLLIVNVGDLLWLFFSSCERRKWVVIVILIENVGVDRDGLLFLVIVNVGGLLWLFFSSWTWGGSLSSPYSSHRERRGSAVIVLLIVNVGVDSDCLLILLIVNVGDFLWLFFSSWT